MAHPTLHVEKTSPSKVPQLGKDGLALCLTPRPQGREEGSDSPLLAEETPPTSPSGAENLAPVPRPGSVCPDPAAQRVWEGRDSSLHLIGPYRLIDNEVSVLLLALHLSPALPGPSVVSPMGE